MKNLIKAALAFLVTLGLLAFLVAPAGALAGPEADNWLNINSPGSYCGYSYASVDASNALPGTAKVFSQGTTIVKAGNPCVFNLMTSQALPYGYLKVQAVLHCRWAGQGDTAVWTSPIALNAENHGAVTVQNIGSGGTLNPCQDPDNLGLEERTVVTSWYLTSFGYQEYTHTTHWVTQ